MLSEIEIKALLHEAAAYRLRQRSGRSKSDSTNLSARIAGVQEQLNKHISGADYPFTMWVKSEDLSSALSATAQHLYSMQDKQGHE